MKNAKKTAKKALKPKMMPAVVFLQKSQGMVMEFFGTVPGTGACDGSCDLGDVDIHDLMSKDELVRKLRDAAKRIAKHRGDVFVVQ